MSEIAIRNTNNQIFQIQKKLPRWSCDNKYLNVPLSHLQLDDLPPLNEINQLIASIENQNCTRTEAAQYQAQLKKFFGAKDDRFQDTRFTKVMIELIMQFPAYVIEKGMNKLYEQSPWFKSPEDFKRMLYQIYSPVVGPLNRAKTFKMRHNQLSPPPKQQTMKMPTAEPKVRKMK